MTVVTVVGASGSTLPVTVNGAAAVSLAQLYAATVNDIAFSGGLVASNLAVGQTPPPVPTGAIGEGVITAAGNYDFPAGYSYVTISTDMPVSLNEGLTTAPTSVLAGDGGTTLYGGAGGGFFTAGGGNNLFSGGRGNYLVTMGDGNNSIYGGSGNDLIQDGAGSSQIFTGAGNDAVFSHGADQIELGSGNSYVDLTGSNSTVSSSTGASEIVDAGSNNLFVGGPAATNLIAGRSGYYTFSGNATVSGGSNDPLSAPGPTTVFGGARPPAVENRAGSLVFIATPGNDATIGAGGSSASVVGAAGSNITFLSAGGTNQLVAQGGAETLNGGLSPGALALVGGSGAASLVGGSGADTLTAGSGNNTLVGGGGGNAFLFTSANPGGHITIADFGSAAANVVQLVGYGAGEAQTALANASNVGAGGSVISLSDNTSITFLNLSADQLKAHGSQVIAG